MLELVRAPFTSSLLTTMSCNSTVKRLGAELQPVAAPTKKTVGPHY